MAAPPVSPVAALRTAAARAAAAGEADAARLMRGYAATLERDPGAMGRIRAAVRENAGPDAGTEQEAVWRAALAAVAPAARAAAKGADAAPAVPDDVLRELEAAKAAAAAAEKREKAALHKAQEAQQQAAQQAARMQELEAEVEAAKRAAAESAERDAARMREMADALKAADRSAAKAKSTPTAEPSPTRAPMLTARQREILAFMRKHRRETGASPTLREMAAVFNVNENAVRCVVRLLEAKGAVARIGGMGRGALRRNLVPVSPTKTPSAVRPAAPAKQAPPNSATGPRPPLAMRLQRATVPDGRTWEAIAEAAARAEGVSLDDVLSGHRSPPVARARHRAWWEIHRAGRYSYPYVARVWGVDHTSVMHGVTTHEARTRRGQAA